MSRVVVVGNGHASHRLVERMCRLGHQGTITVLGAEDRPAYNRVLLTSGLGRALPSEAFALPAPPTRVGIRLGITVKGIDRERRLVSTGTGGPAYHYDELVLATGARVRLPDVPGLLTDEGRLADGVTALRTLDDYERVAGRRTVVLGGGVLGVEAALGLLDAGCDVTLVHPNPYPMDRQLDPAGGRGLAGHLDRLGVRTRLGREAIAYRPGELTLDDGDILETDTLLLCTGVVPEAELARRAGLTVRRGVVVDDRLRTNDPHIHAIGDCAEHDGDVPCRVAPAWGQAETLATLLTGGQARYRRTPAITRLKASRIDLASVGSLDGLNQVDAELVTLWDPARGRYAKLALCDQRIIGAVLLGFPLAIASVSQLHDRGLPVPSGRLGLLLGAAATRTAPVELPENAVICLCNNVTKKALVHAWHRGARGIPALAEATRVTTGCGTCAHDVRQVCDALRSEAGKLDVMA